MIKLQSAKTPGQSDPTTTPEAVNKDTVFLPGQRILHLNGAELTVRSVDHFGICTYEAAGYIHPAAVRSILSQPTEENTGSNSNRQVPSSVNTGACANLSHDAEEFRAALQVASESARNVETLTLQLRTANSDRESLLMSRGGDCMDAVAMGLAKLSGREELIRARLHEAQIELADTREKAVAAGRRVMGPYNSKHYDRREAARDVSGSLRLAASGSPASRIAGHLEKLRERVSAAHGKIDEAHSISIYVDESERLGPVLDEQIGIMENLVQTVTLAIERINEVVEAELSRTEVGHETL